MDKLFIKSTCLILMHPAIKYSSLFSLLQQNNVIQLFNSKLRNGIYKLLLTILHILGVLCVHIPLT